jgi:hypothetical protein
MLPGTAVVTRTSLVTTLPARNFTGNYAAGEQAYIQPPANKIYVINRMLIEIQDTGVIGVGTYGVIAGLSNGISVQVRLVSDDSVVLDLTDGKTIKTNGDWAGLCYDAVINDAGAGNLGYVNVRWTFGKSGSPLRIRPTEKLTVNFSDDLTGLSTHYFMVQGFEY